MIERGARVGAMSFCKMAELRRGRVGREAVRSSVAGARVGDGSWLDRDHVGASRAGPRGTKEHTVGCTGDAPGSIGWLDR
jgi:hypothetical protein